MKSQYYFQESKSESYYHKVIKQFIYRYVAQNNHNILEKSLEKYFKTRRADIYFKLKNGNQIVVEIQHSKISVKEIIERTKEYNNQNIYVLWIFHGQGNCIGEARVLDHKKNVKVNAVEKFLHGLYGGRVYYVNIDKENSKITIPFALHYSPPDNKKNKVYRENYEYYSYRNAYFSLIPNWYLLCSEFNGYKIARFYDKHAKNILKEKLREEIRGLIVKEKLTLKRAKKNVFKKYKKVYGKAFVKECMSKF